MKIKVVPVDEVVAIIMDEYEKVRLYGDPDAVPIDSILERIGDLETFTIKLFGDNLPDMHV